MQRDFGNALLAEQAPAGHAELRLPREGDGVLGLRAQLLSIRAVVRKLGHARGERRAQFLLHLQPQLIQRDERSIDAVNENDAVYYAVCDGLLWPLILRWLGALLDGLVKLPGRATVLCHRLGLITGHAKSQFSPAEGREQQRNRQYEELYR